MKAWHFCDNRRSLRFGDNRPIVVGETLTVAGPVFPGRSGLHGSIRAIDAVRYAPGGIVCRVELAGKLMIDMNMVAAPERTVLWMADATVALREFATREALSVSYLWECPQVVRLFLEGDESLRDDANVEIDSARKGAMGSARFFAILSAQEACEKHSEAGFMRAQYYVIHYAAMARETYTKGIDSANARLEAMLEGLNPSLVNT